MIEILILLPFFAALLISLIPEGNKKLKRIMPIGIIAVGGIQLTLTVLVWSLWPTPLWENFIALTSEGIFILFITSFLFFIVSIYLKRYFIQNKFRSVKWFIFFLLLFYGSMGLAAMADHLILFWSAIELATLMSAPLILTHNSKYALEATWKYIIICSLGIAFALLGVFLLVISLQHIPNITGLDITFQQLLKLANNPSIDKWWLRVAFIFFLIGFGTKMGLAPMHTWLPDAYSMAPSPVSAMLSGALLNCAFLGIFRVHVIMIRNGQGAYSQNLLTVLGLFTMAVAMIFIVRQRDYKRLLAYSSVENVGILAFGTGIGGVANIGVVMHLFHHSLIKGALFLTSGNILLLFKSKKISGVNELVAVSPTTFVVWFAGAIALIGLPPFGLFFSEFQIVMGIFKNGGEYRYWLAFLFLLILLVTAAVIMSHFIKMGFGGTGNAIKRPKVSNLPQAILLVASVIFLFGVPFVPTLKKTMLDIATMLSPIGGQ